MNHGFRGTKDIAFECYALRLQQADLATLAYDNRFFGKSDGENRQLSSKPSQLADNDSAKMN